MQRVLRNLARFPTRLLRTIRRQFNPAFALQRRANVEVPRRLGADRLASLQQIPGTSSAREGRLLAYLALDAAPGGCFVEIGAFKGKSTAMLVTVANLRPDRPVVHSIDPHLGHASFKDPSIIHQTWDTYMNTVRTYRLEEQGLQVHRVMSHEIGKDWSQPISFLWIDGSHDYPDVRTDIEDFTPHVVPGGWVVFDDAADGHFPGTEEAIARHMLPNADFRFCGVIKHFQIFQRRTGT